MGPNAPRPAADPDVVAAIDSFTRVRAALGEVAPVDPSTKNTAISAALAEFDALHATSTPAAVPASATTATVVSLQSRRHRVYRIVSGAAAAAIVGVVAIAALNSSSGSNDDSSSSATAAPAVAAADCARTEVRGRRRRSPEAAPPEATNVGRRCSRRQRCGTGTGARRRHHGRLDAVRGQPGGLCRHRAPTAAPAATAAAADPTSAASPGDQASGYAAVACLSSDQVVLGAIVYQGTPALAVRNTATGALQAIADTDCRMLAEVDSP